MTSSLTDTFGRQISYLRLSLTDRCDLRCSYCMAEKMTFLPRKDLLTLEELEVLAGAFIARGVRKIRLTGGEPLVRRDAMKLINCLSVHLETGALDELTVTTNATQLTQYAGQLAAAGVRRLNVSLDSLRADVFAKLTRRDALQKVLDGINAAKDAGLQIKINTVALKSVNEDEIPAIMNWAHSEGFDMTLIEVMPLGEIEEDRLDQYVSLLAIKDELETRFTLTPSLHKTGGPARYYDVQETGGRIGLITPLTNNFCAGCNRVRVTCTGQIYMCLGQDDKVDLRAALRSDNRDEALAAALTRAMIAKPEKHDFEYSKRGASPAVTRHMSLTGG